jgi:hypothetical protein
MADKTIHRFRKNDERGDTTARSKNSGSIKSASGARRRATFIKGLTRHIVDRDDVLTPDVVDWSLLIVVVVIGVVSVAAVIAPMIGHGISDCRAPNATHDRADRTANNSPGDSAPDTSSNRAAFVSKDKLR